jgi:hypothetical protein
MNDMCMVYSSTLSLELLLKYTGIRSLISGAWVILVTHCHQKCAFLVAVCHARGCMVGCMGRISHTNLKNRIVFSGIATSKNHIELLVPAAVRSETGFAILCKFWSRFDLRQRRNRKFFGEDQGCLRELMQQCTQA